MEVGHCSLPLVAPRLLAGGLWFQGPVEIGPRPRRDQGQQRHFQDQDPGLGLGQSRSRLHPRRYQYHHRRQRYCASLGWPGHPVLAGLRTFVCIDGTGKCDTRQRLHGPP
jgi:hypothetical protein